MNTLIFDNGKVKISNGQSDAAVHDFCNMDKPTFEDYKCKVEFNSANHYVIFESGHGNSAFIAVREGFSIDEVLQDYASEKLEEDPEFDVNCISYGEILEVLI